LAARTIDIRGAALGSPSIRYGETSTSGTVRAVSSKRLGRGADEIELLRWAVQASGDVDELGRLLVRSAIGDRCRVPGQSPQ
jgi:hypothetical protein